MRSMQQEEIQQTKQTGNKRDTRTCLVSICSHSLLFTVFFPDRSFKIAFHTCCDFFEKKGIKRLQTYSDEQSGLCEQARARANQRAERLIMCDIIYSNFFRRPCALSR